MKWLVYIALVFAFCWSCKPKEVTPVEEGPPTTTVVDTGLKCQAIPPSSTLFGWRDSVEDINRNMLSFVFNPVNTNEVICVVQGDLNNYNMLFTLDLVTKKKTFLGNLGEYPPSVNNRGWITFSSIDNNIHVIKSNGDSAAVLTTNNLGINPHWDHSGKRIYFFQKPYLVSSSSIARLNLFGTTGHFNLYTGLSEFACFNKSAKLLYLQTSGTQASLIIHDVNELEDKLVVSRTMASATDIPFSNLCIDQTDENFYWANTKGIFKGNFATLKIDTLLKNCPNYDYRNPIMSHRLHELDVTMHLITPLKNDVLLHSYKAFEMNLLSNKLTEIRIFE